MHSTSLQSDSIAVIGGGNMGEALIEGLVAKGIPSLKILVVEISEQKREKLASALRVRTSPSIDGSIGEAGTVIIAVKPGIVKEVLRTLSPLLSKEQLIVSVAAGVSLGFMEKQLNPGSPVARCMPNIAAKVGRAAVGMCVNDAVTGEFRERAIQVLSSIGTVIEIEEKQFDAVTGLSGSGPAFVFLMMEALVDGGVLAGIPREKALELALLTVEGSAALIRKTNTPPSLAREMVTSPGGTTIEGLLHLEGGGFRGLVMKAVQKAAEKAARLEAALSSNPGGMPNSNPDPTGKVGQTQDPGK
jgi:pyrroline-5-carboxylate reductase